MTIDTTPRQLDVADDLEQIAASIPAFPRGFAALRQMLALLPNPLAAGLQPSLPADELSPPDNAVDTLASGTAGAGTGPGTTSGTDIVPGSIGPEPIAVGAITLPKFAIDIRPVQIVDALPALPDPDYPPDAAIVFLTTDGQLYRNVGDVWTASIPAASGGIESVAALPALPDAAYPPSSVVFLETDGKLYRNVADVWTKAVDGADVTGAVANATNAVNAANAAVAAVADEVAAADITGQIVETQITDLAITTGKLAANAVTAAKIAALTITAAQIAAGTITGAKIAAGTIAAANIAAGTITANEIAAATITGDRLVAGTITTSQIAADTITAANIAANAITSSELAANSVVAGKVAAASIGATEISANAIQIGHLADNPSNLIPNASFEADGAVAGGGAITGWTSESRALVSSATHDTGGYALRLTQTGSVAAFGIETSRFLPVMGGRRLRIECRIRGLGTNNAAANGRIRIKYYTDTAGTAASTASVSVLASPVVGATTAFATTGSYFTIPADAAYIKVSLLMENAGAVGDILYFDSVQTYYVDDNVNAAAGNVVIDSSGITISNGKLILQDEFGATVMVASGFSGSWFDFISTGLYNGRFLAGTAGTVPNGRTGALPYWTVSDPDVTAETLTFISGGSVKMTWGATGKRKQVTSDFVPVNAGRFYEFGCIVDANAAGSTQVDVAIQLDWYAGDQTLISTEGPFTTGYLGGLSSKQRLSSGAAAPSTAAYAKVTFTGQESVAHNSAAYVTFFTAWLASTSDTLGTVSADYISATTLSAPTVIAGNLDITGFLADGGTSFPAGQSTNDHYYRTDLGLWFHYNGTRWLSDELFVEELTPSQMDNGLAATDTFLGYRSLRKSPGSDLWFESAVCRFKVAAGGTALSGSHSWVGLLQKEKASDLSVSTLATFTINSGSSGVWRELVTNVNALADSANYYAFLVGWTKTGTPGSLFPTVYITYRIVAT